SCLPQPQKPSIPQELLISKTRQFFRAKNCSNVSFLSSQPLGQPHCRLCSSHTFPSEENTVNYHRVTLKFDSCLMNHVKRVSVVNHSFTRRLVSSSSKHPSRMPSPTIVPSVHRATRVIHS